MRLRSSSSGPMSTGWLRSQAGRRSWTAIHGACGGMRRAKTCLSSTIISGMGHGTPVAVSSGPERHGAAGPFLLDAGIPSSYHIVRFWGLQKLSRQRLRRPASTQSRRFLRRSLPIGPSGWGVCEHSAARALGAVGRIIMSRTFTRSSRTSGRKVFAAGASH